MMHTTTKKHSHEENDAHSMDVADFRRLNYFYGQMLSAADFQTEQNFFREKMKLHNRCLHGYGTVCGLLVEPVPIPKDCPTDADEKERELRDKLKELREKRAELAASEAAQPPAPAGAGAVPAGEPPAAAAPPAGSAAPAAPAPPAAADALNPPGAPPADKKENGLGALDAEIAQTQQELDKLYKKYCKKEPRTLIQITPGLAIDSKGNELILRHSVSVDLLSHLSNDDYKRVKHGASDLYVSLCYCEEPVDPVRSVVPSTCGATPACAFSKTRDSLRIEVTTTTPAHDHRCDVCCDCSADECLVIARIERFHPGEALDASQIHNDVRRPLGLYDPTTVRGISWRHGHTYTQEQARRILGTDHDEHHPHSGLEIRFSRPVRASTIRRGVLDVWVIEGGRGRSGEIYHKSGEFVHKPKDGYVDRIFYRDTTRETLEPGDRVLIIFRSDFVLDHCCRPVDGEHVGGRVPLLPEYERHHNEEHEEHKEHGEHEHHPEHHEGEHPMPDECCHPPGWPGPWRSGNRIPGGTFESWFYIRDEEKDYRKVR